MCGIAGVVGLTGAAPLARQMLAAIAHRGEPERACEVLDGDGYAIGCNRLAINDPAGGGQPFVDRRARLALVMNGEIYNGVELRRELGGFDFQTGCDTEVALAAWATWGSAGVSRLRGMFALCVLELDSGRVWLARDPLGIKPLYFAAVGGGIAFGSELKCFAGLPVRAVESLPGGSVWSGGAVRSYHRVPPFATRTASEADAAAEVREAVMESVRIHLRGAPEPVACLLSGGVDSSTVLHCMVANGARVEAYTFANPAESSADLAHARELCADLRVPHTIVSPPADELCRLYLEGGVYMTESYEPALVRNAVSYHFLCRAVRRRGHKLCLSGEGADEVFGGYDWMRSVARERQDAEIRGALERVQDSYLQMADRASMYATLEVRVPYMDRALVDRVVALPASSRIDGAACKAALRRAFAGQLLDVCRNRPKVGMNQGAGFGTNEPRSGPYHQAVVGWYQTHRAALAADRATVARHADRFAIDPGDLEEVYAFARFVDHGFDRLAGAGERLQLNTRPRPARRRDRACRPCAGGP